MGVVSEVDSDWTGPGRWRKMTLLTPSHVCWQDLSAMTISDSVAMATGQRCYDQRCMWEVPAGDKTAGA